MIKLECFCFLTGAPDRKRGGGPEEGPPSEHHPADRGGRNAHAALPGHGAR